MSDYLNTRKVRAIMGGVSTATLKRIIRDDGCPYPDRVGRSHYYRKSAVYAWLTAMAGKKVDDSDRLFSTVMIGDLFQKSPTWVWIHFQKNKKRKESAIYIRSRPYWLMSDILADDELVKYLDVSKKKETV